MNEALLTMTEQDCIDLAEQIKPEYLPLLYQVTRRIAENARIRMAGERIDIDETDEIPALPSSQAYLYK